MRALPDAGGRPPPKGSGSRTTLPPAVVMAASAEAEKAWAETVTARESVPLPRTLTSVLARHKPAAAMASRVSSVSDSALRSPMLMGT